MMEVSFDAARFRREANRKIDRQIPFAFSLALNETGDDLHNELRGDLPSEFTIRSDWTKKGIRMKRSTKKRLQVTVGSIDDYMAHQAGGAVVKGSQAVPMGARPKAKSRTMRGRWPRALIQRKGAFIADLGSGPAVYQPSRHKDPKRRRLRLMYRLVDKTQIPKRWRLERTFREVVAREWQGNVTRALRRALRTAR
jgi:hypothetical protein